MATNVITCACGATAERQHIKPFEPLLPIGWCTITVSGHPSRNAVICAACRRRILQILSGRVFAAAPLEGETE